MTLGRGGSPSARDPLAGLRPWISEIEPYVPGKPAEGDAGSLASNESPFGPSPGVQEAVFEALARLHRYPDPLADELRRALGHDLDVDPECILVGNGSDELLYLLSLAFAAGGTVVCADPPYRLDELVARVVGATPVKVPLVGYRHDLEKMAAIEADVAFICNPHNPTGTVVARASLEDFLDRCRARVVVVDEAYVEFTDDPQIGSVVGLAEGGRVVVLRTLSKLFGLAGARVGYLVASRPVVDVLRRIRPPFSVNAVAQAAAIAGLADLEHRLSVRTMTLEGRKRLTELFERSGYDIVPSQANFILVLAEDEVGLCSQLLRGGVSVRPGSTLGIPGAIRVTVPTDDGFRLLEHALETS